MLCRRERLCVVFFFSSQGSDNAQAAKLRPLRSIFFLSFFLFFFYTDGKRVPSHLLPGPLQGCLSDSMCSASRKGDDEAALPLTQLFLTNAADKHTHTHTHIKTNKKYCFKNWCRTITTTPQTGQHRIMVNGHFWLPYIWLPTWPWPRSIISPKSQRAELPAALSWPWHHRHWRGHTACPSLTDTHVSISRCHLFVLP